jgi:hypothetical protein
VFYASETAATAIAEMAFHRLLFFADSPGTPWPLNAGEYTAFSVSFKTTAGLDLTRPPLSHDRTLWTDRTDYGPCQELADRARAAGLNVLRYQSARDPSAGANIAVLTCRAFASTQPLGRQTWRLHLGEHGVRAICDYPEQRVVRPRHLRSRPEDCFASLAALRLRRTTAVSTERHQRAHSVGHSSWYRFRFRPAGS